LHITQFSFITEKPKYFGIAGGTELWLFSVGNDLTAYFDEKSQMIRDHRYEGILALQDDF
jgi:hypothetical protein